MGQVFSTSISRLRRPSARTHTRLVPHRKTRDVFAADDDILIANAYALAGTTWRTRLEGNRVQLLAQPWSVKHQGACVGAHHGKHRSWEPIRAQRDTSAEVFYNIRLQYQTRLLVRPRRRPRYTAHGVRSHGLMSAVLCLARKHGPVLESRHLYTAQDSTGRG